MARMNIRMLLAFLSAALAATTVSAEPRWLNGREVHALFDGGLEYSVAKKRGFLKFSYAADGTWKIETPRGDTAGGTWSIQGGKVCRNEESHSSGWDGVPYKTGCFGIKLDNQELLLGSKEMHGILKDPSVLARLDKASQPTEVASARESAQRFLETTLGLTQERMCALKYYVGTTQYVNAQYSGKNLGFSYCPGAITLP